MTNGRIRILINIKTKITVIIFNMRSLSDTALKNEKFDQNI